MALAPRSPSGNTVLFNNALNPVAGHVFLNTNFAGGNRVNAGVRRLRLCYRMPTAEVAMKYDIKINTAMEEMVAEFKEAQSQWVELNRPHMSWEETSRRDELIEFLYRCEEIKLNQVSHWSALATTAGMFSAAEPTGKLGNVAQKIPGFKKMVEDGWSRLINDIRALLESRFNTSA